MSGAAGFAVAPLDSVHTHFPDLLHRSLVKGQHHNNGQNKRFLMLLRVLSPDF